MTYKKGTIVYGIYDNNGNIVGMLGSFKKAAIYVHERKGYTFKEFIVDNLIN